MKQASKTWLALPLVALIIGACASTPPTTLDQSLEQIRTSPLRKHVKWLAHDDRAGRMTGEAGYDAAAEYVAQQFAAMGLEPGGADGWYQQVPLRSYRSVAESAQFIIHAADGDQALNYRDDFSVTSDPVRESTTIRGEVVFAGFGVHAPDLGYSDYDGIDVEGKIIAIYSGAPKQFESIQRAYYSSGTTKRSEAVARGAIATITLRSRKAEQRKAWGEMKKTIGTRWSMTWVNEAGQAAQYHPQLHGGVYLSPATATALFADAPLSYEDTRAATENGEVRSAALGVEVTIARDTEHRELTSPNVIGVVRGTDPALADEYVVYTAHLDHIGTRETDGDTEIFNGAYDNAMGVALMLETARVFAAVPPRRSVMFVALTAEERGLLGSDYFVRNPVVPIASVVANINLDMPLFLYPLADLVAFGSENSSLQPVADAAAAAEGFVFAPDPLPEETLFVRSDQYSFVKVGVPAVYLVPGFNSTDKDIDGESLYRAHLTKHYHEPSDDLGRPVHWDSAVRFARAHARIGYVVASEERRPTWNEGSFLGERFATP